MYYLYLKTVTLIFLYVEQDVNFTFQSCFGLKNKILTWNIAKNEKKPFAVTMEWVK